MLLMTELLSSLLEQLNIDHEVHINRYMWASEEISIFSTPAVIYIWDIQVSVNTSPFLPARYDLANPDFNVEKFLELICSKIGVQTDTVRHLLQNHDK